LYTRSLLLLLLLLLLPNRFHGHHRLLCASPRGKGTRRLVD
jgi:hypothetical protein